VYPEAQSTANINKTKQYLPLLNYLVNHDTAQRTQAKIDDSLRCDAVSAKAWYTARRRVSSPFLNRPADIVSKKLPIKSNKF
jgi:hypothetical protein